MHTKGYSWPSYLNSVIKTKENIMDLQNTTLNIICPYCSKNITLTFNTIRCPKCSGTFEPESIKRIFYDYESRIANSSAMKFANSMETTGKALDSFGSFLSSLGCVIMGLPVMIILIWFIVHMLNS